MLPEGKLIKNELILRNMHLPEDIKLTKKSLVRWIALSLGLISPNESRTILLDIFEVLIDFHIEKSYPTTKGIMSKLLVKNIKADEKSVYYHLLKMKELGLITRKNGKYSFGEGEDEPLSFIIKQVYQEKFNNSFKNIAQALESLDTYKK